MVTGSIEAVFSSMASLPFKKGGSSAQRADPCAIVMVPCVAQEMVLSLGDAMSGEGRAHVDPRVDPCASDDAPSLATLAEAARDRATQRRTFDAARAQSLRT
jgi:hypothetical protein